MMAENGYRRQYLEKAGKCEQRIAELSAQFNALVKS